MNNPVSATTTITRRALMQGGIALGGAVLMASGAASNLASTARSQDQADTGSRLDPSEFQVIFVDLQTSLIEGSMTADPAAIRLSSGILAKVASILKLPLLFSTVLEGQKPPVLIEELKPFSTPQNTLLRKLAGALTDETTAARLAANRRMKLIVAAYAADVALVHATLDALTAGYKVYYVVDCTGSQSARTEAAAFREIERAGAIPTSVLSLTTRLAPDFFHPPGIETFAALQPLLKK